MTKSWDVIVVGGGPGGAMAAKKCAENGLSTLLIEKGNMPREKCCSGMVMGVWGQELLREELGEYPADVMEQTTLLEGYALHVPGADVRMLDVKTPATPRKILDTWMCRRAADFGAEILDGSRVKTVREKGGQIHVTIKGTEGSTELSSNFVIGADGADSTVRKAVFPDFMPMKAVGYRLCYTGELNIPQRRFNIFQSLGSDLRFYLHNKGNQLFLEGVSYDGQPKETIELARQFLITHHGFDPHAKPLWKDGCMECPMYLELTAGTFRPAKGNVLIIGDAAGLHIPVTGEGLAVAIKGGVDASEAVVSASRGETKADALYLEKVDRLLNRYHEIAAFGQRIQEAAASESPDMFSKAVLSSWDYALKL